MSEKIRVHLLISGRVQGVFYRLETMRAAEERSVTGWVRNLPDGRVEAVAEGDTASVESLIEWCRIGPARAKVDSIDIHQEPFTGEFSDFQITG